MKNYQFDRVMVVDDMYVDRYIAAKTIEKSCFAKEVLGFEMAAEALDYLWEHEEEPEKLPNVLFLDLRMPEINGLQFLEKLKSRPQCLRHIYSIIVLSSSVDYDEKKEVENNSLAEKFLSKPLTLVQLEEIKSMDVMSVK